jgi:hypothetical protein
MSFPFKFTKKLTERECRISTDSSRSTQFRWQTRKVDPEGPRQIEQAEITERDRGTRILQKAAVRTTRGGEPCAHTSAILFPYS